ncbi:MAG: glutathione peroxidase [Rhodospirillaceae bacterium]|nr:glutathione peroxidase [Rhodospirillaceae bacterium]
MLKTVFAAVFAAAMMGGPAMAESAHDFVFEKLEGGKLDMSQDKGKAVLVVNTASFCGYTPQYEGLQSLWESYKDKGLVVLGVPANNFGAQEPGSSAEIKNFCESNYSVDFPMTEKVDVVGGGAHPFYKWAKATLGDKNVPQWNFHKYLVNANGELVAAFPSAVKPESAEIKAAVDKALAK